MTAFIQFNYYILLFRLTNQVSGKLIRKCAPGTELVDWLVNLSPIVHTRAQAAGMWQALLEEGILTHGRWTLKILQHIRPNSNPQELFIENI